MENTRLPPDFKEFLKLLNENEVDYLLIGGYAVGYYGYPRATHDIDIWIGVDGENARKMLSVMMAFGFEPGAISEEVFLKPDSVVRMGVPPLRIEIMTGIPGVAFEDSLERKVVDEIDGVPVALIHLLDLLANKKAVGRYKDLDDVTNLPEHWST